MNVFKHGLAAIQKRREEDVTTEYEEGVRQQIQDGLIADKGVRFIGFGKKIKLVRPTGNWRLGTGNQHHSVPTLCPGSD
jgi:hypothetical protein